MSEYPLILVNEKHVYIFKSKWTLVPICIEKNILRKALDE